MTPSLDISSHWWLVLVGWSVLVVLWHTTAVALLLGVWRLWRRASPAQSHYVAAVGALTAAVILTVADLEEA